MAGKKLDPIKKPLLLFLTLSLLNGCASVYTAHGAYYRFQKGDTLESVAKKFKVEVQDVAEINNIESSEQIKVGRSIYIPGVAPREFVSIIEKNRQPVPLRVSRKKEKSRGHQKKEDSPVAASPDIEVDHGRFVWPLRGDISSGFGMRRGRRHDGIDIRAKIGTPVRAAADGEVVFCKRMRGYGNLVLLKHKDDFFTVYAHNSSNLAKKGRRVKRGDIIAKVGRTGRATGPHLHFEVREGTKPRNPFFFLPKTELAQKAIRQRGGEDEGANHGGPEEENP